MSPNRAVPAIPVAVEVEIAELKGKYELIASKVGDGFKVMFDMQANLQGELREMEGVLREVHSRQHQIQQHSEGLDRLAKLIEKQAENDLRWREGHVKDNDDVAKQVVWWRGIVIGVCLLASAVVGLSVYIVRQGFEDAAKARGSLELRVDKLEARP